MIKIQGHPTFINQLRIFNWSKNLQVDWYNFLDYCRFSNIATIIVEEMTITFLKTTSSTDEGFEWRMTKPCNETFPDELIYIMNLRKYDLEFLSKIQKDKLSGIIYGTYVKKLN
ncbi:MAG: hypothetical protein FWC34_10690 [Bacteroidetes bacterium]|nr:hypothetical protein [Bacteroidota bacterium]MCL2302755.1 hypothetical protein [Lentimicrobiaceae bacterium]